jgi:hypothetical protein
VPQGYQSNLVISHGEGGSCEQIPVKAPFDSSEVNDFPGERQSRVAGWVHFGDADTIEKMSGAKRPEVGGVRAKQPFHVLDRYLWKLLDGDRTALMRDALVAPQSCASNFLPD